MRVKLDSLFRVVNSEVKKAEEIHKAATKAAQEIAASASQSPSQSGDRFHSQGTADLAKQKLDSVLALKDEIEASLNLEIPASVSVPCYIKLDGDEIYLVDNPIIIPDFKIVSSKSTIGESLLGKKVGENGVLELG